MYDFTRDYSAATDEVKTVNCVCVGFFFFFFFFFLNIISSFVFIYSYFLICYLSVFIPWFILLQGKAEDAFLKKCVLHDVIKFYLSIL